MQLVALCPFTLPQLFHPFELRCERDDRVCVQGQLYRRQIACNVAEQNVGGTSGTDKDENSDKGESKHEGCAAESTNYADDSGWKVTATSLRQDCFIVIFFTLFSMNKGMDTIVTDNKVLWIIFLRL